MLPHACVRPEDPSRDGRNLQLREDNIVNALRYALYAVHLIAMWCTRTPQVKLNSQRKVFCHPVTMDCLKVTFALMAGSDGRERNA